MNTEVSFGEEGQHHHALTVKQISPENERVMQQNLMFLYYSMLCLQRRPRCHLELSWCAVEDEHEPEDLVEALHKDVQPHGLVDQRLCASVGGL